MQKPSIGRVVHYSSYGRRRPAIITRVGQNGVDLTVFSDEGPPRNVFTVPYQAEEEISDDPNATTIASGCWTWPPRV